MSNPIWPDLIYNSGTIQCDSVTFLWTGKRLEEIYYYIFIFAFMTNYSRKWLVWNTNHRNIDSGTRKTRKKLPSPEQLIFGEIQISKNLLY